MIEALSMNTAEPKTQSIAKRLFRGCGSLLRITMKLILILCFIGGGFFIGGFLNFVRVVSDHDSPKQVAVTDGIVVLTGGSSRIATALSLLEQGKGRRLLISGVDRNTDLDDIRKLNKTHENLFECCVDSEDIAVDTLGNASETAKWVSERRYKSLLVVTSGYHLPRSMLEFKRAMPEIDLRGIPVALEELKRNNWWTNTDIFRLILSEYLKYLAANVRDYVSADVFAALRTTLRTV